MLFAKERFEELVDQVALLSPEKLPKLDIVIALRSKNFRLNEDRLYGALCLANYYKCPLVQPYESSTREECRYIHSEYCGYDLTLVTHKNHSYRAALNYIWFIFRTTYKFDECGKFFIEQLDDNSDKSIEDAKILEYQAKDDIASYEVGVKYFEWLLTQLN